MRPSLLVPALAAYTLLRASSAEAQDTSTAHVHLHASNDVPVVLETHAPDSPLWTASCTAPCDVDLPVDRDYRVAADGMRTSECIRLTAPSSGQVLLDVHPVSKTVHTTGLVLVGVGLVALVGGDVMSDVFIGFQVAQLVDKSPPPRFANDLIIPGIVIASVGAVAFLTGGGMYLATRTPTRVVQSASPGETAAPSAAHTELVAPLPLWRDAVLSGPTLPLVMSVPLLSARF